MPKLIQEVDKHDYQALLDLLEAVTGTSIARIVSGSLRVTDADPKLNDLPVIRFDAVTAPHRDNTKTTHVFEIRPGEKIEEAP